MGEEGEEEMKMQMEEKNKNKEKEKVKEEEIKVERQPDTEEEKHFRAELQGEDLDTLYSQLPSYNLLCWNFGGRNPLEKMSFYEITPPMRTYIILYLCEYLADYNDKIMKEMEETEAVDQRAHYLGCDSLERDYWFLEQYYSDCRIFRTTTHGEDKKRRDTFDDSDDPDPTSMEIVTDSFDSLKVFVQNIKFNILDNKKVPN